MFETYRFPADYLAYWFLATRTALGPFRGFLLRMRRRGFASMLDVGSGSGGLALHAAVMGFEVTSVDVSRSSLLSAARFAPRLPINKPMLSVVASGERLPLPDHSYDIVVFSHVIEHLAAPRPFLDELYRVLRPGGYLLLRSPSASQGMRVARRFGIDMAPEDHVVEGYDEAELKPMMPPGFTLRRKRYQGRFFEANSCDFQLFLAQLTGMRANPLDRDDEAGEDTSESRRWLFRLLFPFKEAVLLLMLLVCRIESLLFFFMPGCFVEFEFEKTGDS